ncbi:hypothetical protein [Gordonia bronchialis]|jgi:hypothetical protein|uniref:hypothetical protein n=1 Tax=Gordonia bronchialis TaxID=2054 RepID=UPI002432A0F6|nr:hypothetical protein [Gordonia bronchialis]
MDTALEVTVTANAVNAWFLLFASTPALVVDEAVHPLKWSRPNRVAIEPGSHEVAVGIRYRGFSAVLGKAPETVTVQPGETLRLSARNGPLNRDPFLITILDD